MQIKPQNKFLLKEMDGLRTGQVVQSMDATTAKETGATYVKTTRAVDGGVAAVAR